jgi:hypothetical protein
MKPTSTIKITSCRKCPFFKEGPNETTDGWDRGNDWICTAKDNKIIRGFVEWHEVEKIEIPEWCPCLTEPIIS